MAHAGVDLPRDKRCSSANVHLRYGKSSAQQILAKTDINRYQVRDLTEEEASRLREEIGNFTAGRRPRREVVNINGDQVELTRFTSSPRTAGAASGHQCVAAKGRRP